MTTNHHYEALAEPIIEPVGAAETTRIDKFDLPPGRPVQRTPFYIRAHLNDLTIFRDLFIIPDVDVWWQPAVRPPQRLPEAVQRQLLSDLTTFDTLFRTPLVADWQIPDVRPVQRLPFYMRQHLNDIQIFDTLFAAVVTARLRKLRGVGI